MGVMFIGFSLRSNYEELAVKTESAQSDWNFSFLSAFRKTTQPDEK